MAKRQDTKPPKTEDEDKPVEKTSKSPAKDDDEGAGESSSKLGRKTLALILSHIDRREEKNDEIVQKQSKQTWIITILLVLGLLSSIGVASAVKFYGLDLDFSGKSDKDEDDEPDVKKKRPVPEEETDK